MDMRGMRVLIEELLTIYTIALAVTMTTPVELDKLGLISLLREGIKKKKIVEFSTKVGGWGQQWTVFLLFSFFLEKKYEIKHWMLP